MKKYMLMALIVTILVLGGCSTQETPEPSVNIDEEQALESEPAIEETVETETKNQEPAEETAPAEEERPPMSKKVQELLQKNKNRITSMTYMYQDSTTKPEEWQTWVKGYKMHVKLRELDNVRDDIYIDNVYIDIASRKAVGYCERVVARCDDPNKAVTLNFNKYFRKTPIDWITELDYAVDEGEEQMSMRTVHKLVEEDDDTKTIMFVDDYYGVPSLVRVTKNSVTSEYIYEDIAFNTIEDTQLEHQQVSKVYR